jgi:hypothetical protein
MLLMRGVYDVEVSLGGMIYTPSFVKIGSGFKKFFLGGEIHIQTHRQQGYFISSLLFFKNKESRLKRHVYYSKFDI